MKRPRLFAELPAGLASVSLALHGGVKLKPPISRLGRKTKYTKVILEALGLRPGQGADAYLWAEADLEVAALLRCYPDAAALRQIAAIIRGWQGEDARALWYRLREERWARLGGRPSERKSTPAPDSLEQIAEWAFLSEGSFNRKGPDASIGHPGGDASGGFNRPVAEFLPDSLERIAKWAFLSQGSFSTKGPDAPIGRPDGFTSNGYGFRPVAEHLPDALTAAATHPGWPSVAVTTAIPDPSVVAKLLGTPGDLSGCIIYADPPYENTSKYDHDLPRDEVVQYCLAYADMGATVCVSEQEPIPELMQAGWHATEITADRVGARRVFSKQQAEWLTMSVAHKRQKTVFDLFSPDCVATEVAHAS